MSVSRGNIHKYIGITLDYTVRVQCMITMISYIKGILTTFDKADLKGGGKNTTNAPNNLLVFNKK